MNKNKITNDIYYVGVNDHNIDLFEGQYKVPNGMSYNSYVVLDKDITIFDTVDINFFNEWLSNIKTVIKNRLPKYLVIQHMEPDHSANIIRFLEKYPDTYIVGNEITFMMIEQFFHKEIPLKVVVQDKDTLTIGRHSFLFTFAPMVHWPEVMVTYDISDKVLFSADAFGKFGANDIKDPEGWDCEARRYYFGIVGKYGQEVQVLLNKAKTLDIKIICPLHGPILNQDLDYYLYLYNTWSQYLSETDGVAIFYTSIYGHTREAVHLLAKSLLDRGVSNIVTCDLAREDIHECVENAFRYSKVVFATTTYNGGIFPIMNQFIDNLVERNFQNKIIGLIENGSWLPKAGNLMLEKLSKLNNITIIKPIITIKSSMDNLVKKNIETLADSLKEDYPYSLDNNINKDNNSNDEVIANSNALFNLGYGLYAVTCKDENKDNALILNSVTQVTNNPDRLMVCINKANYSHDIIRKTKKMNVNVISEKAPFEFIKKYGFVSGYNINKFDNEVVNRSSNNLIVFAKRYINSYISLEVESYTDLGSHGMFICLIKESKVISNEPTMTYNYYQNNVKPKPNSDTKKKGWVCKVCGYVYEGEELPKDFVCPICKHGAEDFEIIN